MTSLMALRGRGRREIMRVNSPVQGATMLQTLAIVELPSSNARDDINTFINALNLALDDSKGVAVAIEWRGNRRFLRLQKNTP